MHHDPASDARAIENLIYRYAELLDAGDLAGVGELFAHGRIEAMPDAPPELRFDGAAAVEALYRSIVKLHPDGTPRTQHVTTNVAIEVDGDAAVARSRYTVMQATPSVPLQAVICGRYEDRFERIDGSWRFVNRTMFMDLTGDLSDHVLALPGTAS